MAEGVLLLLAFDAAKLAPDRSGRVEVRLRLPDAQRRGGDRQTLDHPQGGLTPNVAGAAR